MNILLSPATFLNIKRFLVVSLVILACIFAGKVVTTFSPKLSLIAIGSMFILFTIFQYPSFAIVLLIFSMLLSPEIVVGSLPRRDIVIRIEDLILLVLGLMWFLQLTIDKKIRDNFKTPINKFIIFYCAVFIFATGKGMIVGNIQPLRGTFYILKYIEYYVLFFLALNFIHNKKQIKIFLMAFLLTFVIVNIYAISQIGIKGRVSAPFEGAGEPNTLGGYQVLMIALCIGLLLHIQSLKGRILLLLISGLTIYPFLNTLSRSSYMSIIPMYLTFIFLHKSKKLFLIFTLIGVVVLSVFFIPDRVVDRIKYTFIPHSQETIAPVKVGGVTFGPSASARIQSWLNVVERWKTNPYFGYGVTGLGFLDSQYIRIFAETGAIGLVAFIMLLTAIYRNVLRVYRTSKDQLFQGLALGFLAGHVGMIFHAVTANTFVIIRIMEPYWFLVAMIMVIPRIERLNLKAKEINQKIFSSEKSIKNTDILLNGGGSI